MRFIKKQPKIEVFFDNGTKVGEIKFDSLWNEWRIEFERGIRLSYYYLKDLCKYLRRLK